MKSAERLKKWEEFVVCVSDSSSTQDSKYCPREEILQSKGRLYQLHKEKMKKEQEKEVMALATFHPEINSRYESKEK